MIIKKRQYRIGIDARMLGAERTGIGKYIARLVEYVPPLLPEARFVVFLREPEFSHFSSPYANVEKRKVSAHWYGYKEQIIFPLELMRTRVDLMHFPHFNVPLAYPRKFLVTIHDLTPLYFPRPKMNSWWRKTAFRWVFSQALRRAEKIITVSEYTRNDIVKNFQTNQNKISVIYEGVDNLGSPQGSQLLLGNNEAAREMLASEHFTLRGNDSISFLQKNYGIAKPFILYVGVWREHKNLPGLIQAFGMLLKKYHLDIDLMLCGKEQPSYLEPRQTWERLGVGDRVKRPGFIPEEDLPHFYRAAKLTVVPSLAEGFGFTGLESLSCGTPVAASRTTSLPEILGEAAAYFDPHNPEDMARVMQKVLEDEAWRNNILAQSKVLLSRYRWAAMAQRTVDMYGRILAK